MRAGPPPSWLCDHCARPPTQAELMFVARRGGIHPRICATCVEQYHAIVVANRQSPALAAAVIEACNTAAENRR